MCVVLGCVVLLSSFVCVFSRFLIVWGCLGSIFGRFGGVLGRFWVVLGGLGRSRPPLEASWQGLGGCLGGLEPVLGRHGLLGSFLAQHGGLRRRYLDGRTHTQAE